MRSKIQATEIKYLRLVRGVPRKDKSELNAVSIVIYITTATELVRTSLKNERRQASEKNIGREDTSKKEMGKTERNVGGYNKDIIIIITTGKLLDKKGKT